MECLYCKAQNHPGAPACRQCGKPLPVYGAPEGFFFDPASGYYYRQSETAGGVQTMWFNPISGQYTAEEAQREPPPPSFDPPPPEPAEPVPPGPEGFALEQTGTLYYRVDDSGEEDGAYVRYVTWYDPQTQEYAQVKYSSPMPAQGGKKLPIALAAVVLVAVLGVFGWRLLRGGNSTVPEADAGASPSVSGDVVPTQEQPDEAPADALTWKEPLIEQAVRDWLGKPEGAITRNELAEVSALFLYGDVVSVAEEPGGELLPGSIQSLEDARNFPELRVVIVINNRINGLEPLAGMDTIEQVTALSCTVSDLSTLATLPNLTDLHLSGNAISDIGPLADCPKLRYVTLDRNRITDASPLAELPALETLDLEENPIADWSVVAHVEDLRGAPEKPTYIGDERFGDLNILFAQTKEELMAGGIIPEEVHTNDGYLEYYRADDIDGSYAFVPPWDAPSTGGSEVQAIVTSTEVAFGVERITVGELRDELFGPNFFIGEYQDMDDSIQHELYADLGAYIIYFTDATGIEDDDEVSSIFIIVRERTSVGRGER